MRALPAVALQVDWLTVQPPRCCCHDGAIARRLRRDGSICQQAGNGYRLLAEVRSLRGSLARRTEDQDARLGRGPRLPLRLRGRFAMLRARGGALDVVAAFYQHGIKGQSRGRAQMEKASGDKRPLFPRMFPLCASFHHDGHSPRSGADERMTSFSTSATKSERQGAGKGPGPDTQRDGSLPNID
jgi:hypothetical protein